MVQAVNVAERAQKILDIVTDSGEWIFVESQVNKIPSNLNSRIPWQTLGI